MNYVIVAQESIILAKLGESSNQLKRADVDFLTNILKTRGLTWLLKIDDVVTKVMLFLITSVDASFDHLFRISN